MFKNVIKADLLAVLNEIGETADQTLKVCQLKDLLLKSKEYLADKEFVQDFLSTTVNQRKQEEELNIIRIRQENEVSHFSSTNIENTVSIDKLLKAVITLTIPVPKKNETWNLFFDSIERAFKHKNVPKEFKSEILLKLIGEKAANILVYINDEDLKDYEKIKTLIIKEYEPSPIVCLDSFKKSKRMPGETHQQFASRLRSTWLHYCNIRKVNDFNSLINLIISDKIFETLDSEVSTHIAVKQGENWLLPEEMAKQCDIYFTAKGRSFDEIKNEKRFIYREPVHENTKYIPPQLRKSISENKYIPKNRDCYICSGNHLAKFCVNRRNRYDPLNKLTKDAQIKSPNSSQVHVNKPIVTNVNSKHLECGENLNEINLYPLQKINICIAGREIESIIDGGAQISVLNTTLIPDLKIEPKGKIILQSAFTEEVEAQLITLKVDYKNPHDCIFSSSNILFALTDRLNVPCLITPDVYQSLIQKPQNEELEIYYPDNEQSIHLSDLWEKKIDDESKLSSHSSGLQNEMNSINDEGGKTFDKQIPPKAEIQLSEKENELNLKSNVYMTTGNEFSEANKFRKTQRECNTLKNSFKDASLGKNNFFLRDDLLFHKDNISGETVFQLVLPESYRNKVLQLAHDSLYANHLGMRKTKERIKLSFYWPGISQDVQNYCKTCEKCQLKSPERQSDKIPITPVVRAPYPFHTVNIDLIGEIVPPSGRKHKYCLCLIDQNTRWPEVIPLKSLSAKVTCDALLEIFMRTGIPEIICSDRGTNFTSQLTREFEDRLGASPRFSTPGFPASNGLVEKWNRVFKQMLHHVIRSDPVNWDKHIPFLLFAYREVPNCTTGVSPFKLMYGREARGPLTVLKSSWSGEIPLPLNLSNSAIDYLQELKINLERAADMASLTAAGKQDSYAKYFNRGKRMKEFKTGDTIYLLIPDSTNKLYARWTGPGEIVNRINPHSYKVKLPDGSLRHVHANKIRPFHARVQTVGVIFEDDVEFGEIHPTPFETPPVNNIEVDINHLESNKQTELLELLYKHASLFSGKVQVADVGEHKIRLIQGAERKKPYIYKIPESLKSEVDTQISELENLGLIEPSEAEIAYPIVCVAKKDGSMRLCIDFRLLNAVTKPFDYPMENVSDLINQIGHANIITCLDVLKGYWEIPLEEKSRDYTSFKTHRSQYRWKVMPFGLRNAAASFQKVMNNALSEYSNFCRAYLDDIAIFSSDWETHLLHLDAVLTKLAKLKFTVNVRKCVFAKSQIKYLGHLIGAGRHQPDPDKLHAIEIIEAPKTKTALKSALGLFNYYRDYIKNYAELAKPLTDLTKKKVPELIPWTNTEELAFQELKKLLCEAPTLYTPDPKKPYTIQCDASSYGVGACLSQKDNDENLRPISFASQKLNKVQQNWATIEREAYAVVWALKKFETYVFGSNIELITDHNPLTFLQKSAPQSAKLQRWALALQKYNIHISHCPGAKLKNADGLSRLVSK